MKYYFLGLISLLSVACNTAQTESQTRMSRTDYANTITVTDLSTHLFEIAGDDMQGRMTGSEGQQKAQGYLKEYYQKEGIQAPMGDGNYFQEIPADYFQRMREPKPSANVMALIKGSEFPEEVIVLSAHYDHVGMDEEGNVYNGADDDGSGTVAMLEMAQAFQLAVKNGQGPKRSILFLHVTGEEIGLYGSRYYTENPLFPLANTVCNLNTDMIGRVDEFHKEDPNYIYLIGSDRLSQDLHDLSEKANQDFVGLDLVYTYNAKNDPNRFYYRSDHYNFAKHGIPVIFYFNGTHEDYHKTTDTPDKINYELLAKRTQLIFQTAWEVANRENRIRADKLD